MANLRKTKNRNRSKAQAFVEFAIIIPLLLIVMTGIIEFGYAFYTWAAVGEVARIGTRYAVTGEYDVAYCADADTAFGLAADDAADGTVDCRVPSSQANFEEKTALLQDWARLPSTRDAAMNGGAIGMLFDPTPAISGDYVEFLTHPATRDGTQVDGGFLSTYRGNPTANGFISVNVCSNRAQPYQANFDPNDHYYNQAVAYDNHYLGVCVVTDGTNQVFKDDAGGPGDRIRLTVTYNHPLIIPFFSALWPHLKISTTQDAIVEKFRTSRLAGLSSGISVLSTWSPTPGPTNTPEPPTLTFTPSLTTTSTPTPQPCPAITDGTGLRANFYAFVGSSSSQAFDNLVLSRVDSVVDWNWGYGSPDAVSVPVDNFRGRWEGWVYPPYPGDYTFETWSDDGVNLWIDGGQVITNWGDHGNTLNTGVKTLACQKYTVKLEYYEASGGAIIRLGWSNGNIGDMMPIQTKYLYPLNPVPLATSTYLTPTPTRTFTASATRTPAPPTNTRTASLTFTASNTFTATVPTVTVPVVNTPTVPTNTPRPPTATFTPKPTCGISSDLGGCTPVP